ncbi:MAG: DUF6577 family protein [Butyribacter sp.]|nr:hypothetical protein [bacterium]MDY3854992.1 DUF6577 family protein [Butyribacter sp.]
MIEKAYFKGIINIDEFTREELLESFRKGGYQLSEASFYKKVENMVNAGELVRIGRNRYCLPNGKQQVYSYDYSELTEEVASYIVGKYPYLDFTIFELVQMNDFVNHMMAHNVIFLSVESDVMDFVFDSLKEKYPGKVLINPTEDIYHQYWSDNMIVIVKLITEAPKGQLKKWHTRLEKLLVDIMSEPLLLASISESEYPEIYMDAFERYYIDEKCLFRYANRRKSTKKIKELIQDKTDIVLKTKE